ncbi:hypothetical protein KW795_02340, partial [Candidatus Microgenomates bacterium]|nr:hypothetical protein [Candidatus Microgenomates bacterium]
MVCMYITFYFVIAKVTKSKLTGFFASLLFIVSYFGSIEMFGEGRYERFTERVLCIIPLLISFYLLHKFYLTKKIRFFVYSWILYTVTLLVSHFAILYLPFFIVYTFLKINKKDVSQNKFLVAIPFLYLSVILYILLIDIHAKMVSNVDHLLQLGPIVEKVVYQLVHATIPVDMIYYLAKEIGDKRPFLSVMRWLIYPVLAIYLFGSFVVYKKNKSMFIVYLSFLIGIFIHMFLYTYIDDKLNVLKDYGPSRMFFISGMYVSVMWAMLINSFFEKTKQKIIISLVLTFFVIYNINTIWNHMYEFDAKFYHMRNYLSYVKKLSNQFDDNTVIVQPHYLMLTEAYVYTFYGTKDTTFLLPSVGWEKDERLKGKKVFVLDYDFKNGKISLS